MNDVYSGTMNGPPNDTERQPHLRDYWRTVWAGRWTVATVFVVVVTIGVLATFLQTRIYRATATLEISPRAQRVVRVDDVSQIGAAGLGWSAEDRYFKTQLEVIRSRDVAERAFNALGLKDHPLFRDAKDPIARFMSRLEVEPTPDTLIVTLSMEGPDPQEVAAWVNAVADSYVTRNIEQANQATEDAIGALIKQMEPLRENLIKREQEKFRYAREQKVYVPETQKSSYNERLASLEKDYTDTKLKRLELEAVFRKIEEIERAGGDYFVIPQVANDEVLRGLNREKGELEAEQRRLLVTFKPGHYKVKENEAALGKLNQRITSETNRIISAIRTEYGLAEEREADLAREIQSTKEEALAISEKTSTYNILSTESEEAKRIYDLVAQRVKEVDLNSSLLRNNLAVIDKAEVPAVPVRPRRIVNVAVSALMGLALGIGLIFFLEYIDNSVRSAEQLEREFGLGTLAVIPRRTARSEAAVSEAFSSLRTGVQFSSMNRARRVLLVTSAGPREGKTLTAVMLAQAMARAGERVCLVDADLRHPDVHRMIGIEPGSGLVGILSGGGGPAATRAATRGGDGGPAVIPAGAAPPRPAELLVSEKFAALVAELKAGYDWVIVDSPPAAGLTDAVLIAARSDMVIFVARQSRTDRDVLRRALESIRTANPNVVGAVLNDVDLRRSTNRTLYYPTYDVHSAKSVRGSDVAKRRPAAL